MYIAVPFNYPPDSWQEDNECERYTIKKEQKTHGDHLTSIHNYSKGMLCMEMGGTLAFANKMGQQ